MRKALQDFVRVRKWSMLSITPQEAAHVTAARCGKHCKNRLSSLDGLCHCSHRKKLHMSPLPSMASHTRICIHVSMASDTARSTNVRRNPAWKWTALQTIAGETGRSSCHAGLRICTRLQEYVRAHKNVYTLTRICTRSQEYVHANRSWMTDAEFLKEPQDTRGLNIWMTQFITQKNVCACKCDV